MRTVRSIACGPRLASALACAASVTLVGLDAVAQNAPAQNELPPLSVTAASPAPEPQTRSTLPTVTIEPRGVATPPDSTRQFRLRLRRVLRPDRGEPLPAGARRITRANADIIGWGAGVFALGYVAAFIAWTQTLGCGGGLFFGCSMPSPLLNVPLVGPWIALGEPGLRGAGVALVVVDGIVQLAGLGVMIVGGVRRRRFVEEYFEEWVPAPRPRSVSMTLRVTPIGVSGAF